MINKLKIFAFILVILSIYLFQTDNIYAAETQFYPPSTALFNSPATIINQCNNANQTLITSGTNSIVSHYNLVQTSGGNGINCYNTCPGTVVTSPPNHSEHDAISTFEQTQAAYRFDGNPACKDNGGNFTPDFHNTYDDTVNWSPPIDDNGGADTSIKVNWAKQSVTIPSGYTTLTHVKFYSVAFYTLNWANPHASFQVELRQGNTVLKSTTTSVNATAPNPGNLTWTQGTPATNGYAPCCNDWYTVELDFPSLSWPVTPGQSYDIRLWRTDTDNLSNGVQQTYAAGEMVLPISAPCGAIGCMYNIDVSGGNGMSSFWTTTDAPHSETDVYTSGSMDSGWQDYPSGTIYYSAKVGSLANDNGVRKGDLSRMAIWGTGSPTGSISANPITITLGQSTTITGTASDSFSTLRVGQIYLGTSDGKTYTEACTGGTIVTTSVNGTAQKYCMLPQTTISGNGPTTFSRTWTPSLTGTYKALIDVYDNNSHQCSNSPYVTMYGASYPFAGFDYCGSPSINITVNLAPTPTPTFTPTPTPTPLPNYNIAGKVYNNANSSQAISGASISIFDQTNGLTYPTTTDVNGNFSAFIYSNHTYNVSVSSTPTNYQAPAIPTTNSYSYNNCLNRDTSSALGDTSYQCQYSGSVNDCAGPQGAGGATGRCNFAFNPVAPNPPTLTSTMANNPNQCLLGPDLSTNNDIQIQWTDNAFPVTWVDISDNNSNFTTYYHKNITNGVANTANSTYAPAGFTLSTGTTQLVLNPGHTYYVRLYNGVDGASSGITIATCNSPAVSCTNTPNYSFTNTNPYNWTASTSGGDGNYSVWSWIWKNSSGNTLSGCNSSTCPQTYTSPGSQTVTATVTDTQNGVGYSATTSPSCSVQIYSPLSSVTCAMITNPAYIDNPVTWSASGGTDDPNLYFSWKDNTIHPTYSPTTQLRSWTPTPYYSTAGSVTATLQVTAPGLVPPPPAYTTTCTGNILYPSHLQLQGDTHSNQ